MITFDDVSMILFIQDLLEVFKPFNDDGMKLLTPAFDGGFVPTAADRGGTRIQFEFKGIQWEMITNC